jgi:hypothetical protein
LDGFVKELGNFDTGLFTSVLDTASIPKKGRATPQKDIDCIKERLKRAAEHYKENYQSKKTG